MDKQTQDRLWASLPKEVRDEIKNDYKFHPSAYHPYFDEGYSEALKIYFGKHNLTSDTEPEEMLTILRKDITEEYKQSTADLSRTGNLEYKGKREILKKLFGDKCLPDKEEPKPKFKVGQLVMDKGRVGRILEYDPDREFPYLIHLPFNNSKVYRLGSNLEPYTEPETKSMKLSDVKDKIDEYFDSHTEEEVLEALERHRTIEISDNMEEKELNLAELLKGCEGENLYNPCYGKCVLKNIDKANNNGSQPLICVTLEDGTHRNFSANGKICWAVDKFAPISLFPYSLYEKYPLDPYSAWMEWSQERKPKYNVKVTIECWQDNDDNPQTKTFGATYSSEEESKQAADGIREYLKTFHEIILSQNLDNPK